jgi:hypothetical protein
MSMIVIGREYELMTEAHTKLSVVRKCSKSSLHVSGGGESAGGRGVVSRVGRFLPFFLILTENHAEKCCIPCKSSENDNCRP